MNVVQRNNLKESIEEAFTGLITKIHGVENVSATDEAIDTFGECVISYLDVLLETSIEGRREKTFINQDDCYYSAYTLNVPEAIVLRTRARASELRENRLVMFDARRELRTTAAIYIPRSTLKVYVVGKLQYEITAEFQNHLQGFVETAMSVIVENVFIEDDLAIIDSDDIFNIWEDVGMP